MSRSFIWTSPLAILVFMCTLESSYSDHSGVCQPHAFACANGRCIHGTFRCDGDNDCGDNTDEENCAVCKPRAFTCANARCIPARYRCDGDNDCGDDTDEENCHVCLPDEFACGKGKCISARYRCDGDNDCGDNTDEENCTVCKPRAFTCANARCIPARYRCNGYNDCGDDTDEENCRVCDPPNFLCANGRCIHESYRCDGDNDCRDNSDEENCRVCHPRAFACANGRCISASYRCNGVNDCGDDTDEESCHTTTEEETTSASTPSTAIYRALMTTAENPGACPSSTFACANGKCVDARYRCDRDDDCEDYSDEKGCWVCDPPNFLCANGRCIRARYRCDGDNDCRDNSDEENCHSTTEEATTSASIPSTATILAFMTTEDNPVSTTTSTPTHYTTDDTFETVSPVIPSLASTTLESVQHVHPSGKIAGIIIGVLGGLTIVLSAVGFYIYKKRRNITSTNFSDPIYTKKAEDQFNIEMNQS